MNSPTRQSGVTLVEMIIVIGIAAILTAIGVPSYRYVTTSNRVAGEITGFSGDVQFARYEAIKEGLPVTICPVTSDTATTCSPSTTWSTGWIVLSNPGAAGGAKVVRRQQSFASLNYTLDTLTSPTLSSLVFNREGFAVLAGSGMFSLHDASGQAGFTRCLIINATGAVTIATAGTTVSGLTCS